MGHGSKGRASQKKVSRGNFVVRPKKRPKNQKNSKPGKKKN
jgi:hypothetical protein